MLFLFNQTKTVLRYCFGRFSRRQKCRKEVWMVYGVGEKLRFQAKAIAIMIWDAALSGRRALQKIP